MPESLTSLFHYSWENVVACFWNKYPNKFSKHVLSEDVLDRKILKNGNLYTKRILTKTSPVPKWGGSIFPSSAKNVAYIVEESIIDRKNKIMTVFTKNITLKSLMEVTEKIILKPGLKAHTSDCFKEGLVHSAQTAPIKNLLEKFGKSKWHKNAVNAHTGFEEILNKHFSPKSSTDVPALKHSITLTLPRLSDQTKESIKSVKEKAKNVAIDVASKHAHKASE